MPTKERIEDEIIRGFLSTYENASWADAEICWPDKIKDSGIDALATRASDKKTLAIEHTIVQPFVDEKKDFSFFKRAGFLDLEKDVSLHVQDRWIRVFIPVGILIGQKKQDVSKIVNAFGEWLRLNRSSFPDGYSEQLCPVTGIAGKPNFVLELNVQVVSLNGKSVLHIRRQQDHINLGVVVEKTLAEKLPKLASTEADRRILLLERQHMNLYPQKILDEIEKLREKFKNLNDVHEIWFVETMFYESESALYFARYKSGSAIDSFPIFPVSS